MTSREHVLERNLELLFTRAYAPVRAPADFRDRLLRELATRITVPQAVRPFRRWRAAAAILSAFGIGFVAWHATRAPSAAVDVESLLAAGAAAVREGPQEAWRALSEEEARSGVRYEGPSLELATPREVSVGVNFGSPEGLIGRIDAEGSSRVLVEDSVREDGLIVSLARGSVSVERRGDGKSWRLSTAEGSVRIGQGVLELACLDLRGSPAARALLREGSAALAVEPHTALVPGSEAWLQDGALVGTAALETPDAAAPQRTDAGTSAESAASVPAIPPTTQASLHGVLALPPGAKAPESYVVTLLRRERLPEVSEAQPRVFQDPAFVIDGLRPGSYSVFVEVAGYAVWQRIGIELAPGTPTVELEIALDAGASLSGRVLDPEGLPVAGARILSETDVPAQLLPFSLEELPAKWSAVATAQADGTFELAHLSRARHRLRATHPGYGAAWSEEVELASVPSPGSVAGLTLRLVRPGAIEGTVARDDGTPWPSAIVVASFMDSGGVDPIRGCLHFSMAVADLQGHYAIEDLPPGQFVVLNVLEGQQPGAGRVPRVQTVRVESGVRSRVDLPGSVLGTAVAGTLLASDDTPLGDLDITFVPMRSEGQTKSPDGSDWKSTRSREDGRFDFPSLPPGTYAIYVGGELGAQLAFQGVVEVPAVPTFAHTVRAGAGTLRGRVLDDRTGAGLPSCAVIVEFETSEGVIFAGRAVTDAQGGYDLPRLPAGKYRATAYAGVIRYGQETSEGVVVGEGRDETALDFKLRAGASLLVKVVDSGGQAVSGANIQFREERGGLFSFSPDDRTDGSGQLRIAGLKPGRWTVRASSERFEKASNAIDLVAGEESTVEITLTSPR